MTLPTAIHRSKQGLATLLSLCLLWTSANLAEAVGSLSSHAPLLPQRPIQFELAPPLALGSVVDSFNAASPPAPLPVGEGDRRSGEAPLVILIQDLHAHYGVQKNIAGILNFL